MKKHKVYLESSALWDLYYEERGADLVEHCLENSKVTCFTSEWSSLELTRGIQKRVNQQEITLVEAQNLKEFIEADLRSLVSKKKLHLVPVSQENIEQAKKYVYVYNLYGSDALHLATAVHEKANGLLVDDYHFERLNKQITKDEGQLIWSTALPLKNFRDTLPPIKQ